MWIGFIFLGFFFGRNMVISICSGKFVLGCFLYILICFVVSIRGSFGEVVVLFSWRGGCIVM